MVLSELRTAGVDLHNLQVDDHRVAGVMVVAVAPGGEKTMMGGRGANPYLDPEALPVDEIRSASLLHVSGYCFLEEPQRCAALRAMQIAREAAIPVSFDPGLNPVLRARNSIIRGLALSDLVFANAPEATHLTGASDLLKAVLELRNYGPQTVAIKLGGEGCLIRAGETLAKIPAFPVTPVDTTGAGDAWNAGFLAGHLAGESLEVSGLLANAAAASAVEKVGTGASMVSRRRMEEIIDEAAAPEELSTWVARVREILR
jgi:ribokinase